MVQYMTSAAALLTASAALASAAKHDKTTGRCVSCSPNGWRSTNGPAVGADMIPLYVNLVQSVKSIHFKRDTLQDTSKQKRAAAPLCCTEGTSCVLLSNFLIPFCYDKYTTNFLFPDSSHGNIVSGMYNTSTAGEYINLITGNVTNINNGPNNNGTNIYASNSTAKPNTSTLPIPAIYTGAGDGIHVTSLGQGGIGTITGTSVATATIIVPASTRAATTVPAFTGSDGVVTPARTIAATTVPAVTVAAVQSRAAAVQVRKAEDALRLERIGMMYVGVMGVFGGLAMVM